MHLNSWVISDERISLSDKISTGCRPRICLSTRQYRAIYLGNATRGGAGPVLQHATPRGLTRPVLPIFFALKLEEIGGCINLLPHLDMNTCGIGAPPRGAPRADATPDVRCATPEDIKEDSRYRRIKHLQKLARCCILRTTLPIKPPKTAFT